MISFAGEVIQPLLHAGLSAPLLVIAFVQDYTAVLLMGFLSRSGGE